MTGYKIFTTKIPNGPAGCRRENERTAEMCLLREAGREIEGIEEIPTLDHDEHGAPYLPDYPEIHISISHNADICVLAVSNSPIGIDIEAPRPQLRRVATKFLTTDEQSRLTDIESDENIMMFLLKAWTAKEAVFKAAAIPDLVLSEIDTEPGFTHASARGVCFQLAYPLISAEKIIAVATVDRPDGEPCI